MKCPPLRFPTASQPSLHSGGIRFHPTLGTRRKRWILDHCMANSPVEPSPGSGPSTWGTSPFPQRPTAPHPWPSSSYPCCQSPLTRANNQKNITPSPTAHLQNKNSPGPTRAGPRHAVRAITIRNKADSAGDRFHPMHNLYSSNSDGSDSP